MPTGWNVRLEYLTWDTTYGGAVTEITTPALVDLGEHSAEFDNDGLPYGLCAPQKLSLRLNYSQLPSAMRDYLKYGYDTTLPPEEFLKRNTWWLWTDRGTNGATYYLEFVGCEETSEGVDLEPGPGDTYEYSVELVDAFYHAMKTCTGYEMFRTVTPTSSQTPTRGDSKLFNILVTDERARNVYQQSLSFGDTMVSADDLIALFCQGVSAFMNAKYMRSPTSGYPNYSILGASTLQPVFTSALELKSSTVTGLPRTTDTTLTGSTMFLNWRVTSGPVIGGLSSDIDKYGWGRKDITPWDILHDLAETMGVKISYEFQFSAPYNSVVVSCNVRRVGSTLTYGDSSTNAYDVRLGADKMLERAKIVKRGSGIQKAEVQYETEFDEDAKAVMRIASATRGSRSMNIEPIVHNIPTYQSNSDDPRGRYGPPLQTNQIYSRRSNLQTYVLAHENTRYRYLPGASGAYVEATTTAGATPIQHKDDNENVGEYRLQLNAIQVGATMQTALAKFAVWVFGAEQNAIAETKWNLLHTTEAMPHKLGAVHDLSYAQDGGSGGTSYLESTFDEMTWGRCILTRCAVNYLTGECAVTYYVLSQTGNNT